MARYDEASPGAQPPADDREFLRRLGDEVLLAGPKVGARFGLDPPESVVADLYINCVTSLPDFDRSRSLRGWVFGHAYKVALHAAHKVRIGRMRERSGSQEALDGQLDRHDTLAEFLNRDSPASLSDAAEAELSRMIDERRQTWEYRRDVNWAEAQLDLARRSHRQAMKRAARVGLYDVLIGERTEKLLVPWMVLWWGLKPEEIGRRRGLATNSIHQAVCRFKGKVRARTAARRQSLGL